MMKNKENKRLHGRTRTVLSYPAYSSTRGPSCSSAPLYFYASERAGSLSHLLPIRAEEKKAAFTLLISSGFNHESISSVAQLTIILIALSRSALEDRLLPAYHLPP